MSGTGNTYRVSKWMGDAATSAGAKTEVKPIEQGCSADDVRDSESQLIGLLTPAHGFTAPWMMIRFALRMPRRKKTHAFVACTRGGIKCGPIFIPGMEGTTCYLLALILALKGYHLRGIAGFDMPTNWTALHPGFSKASAEAMAFRAKPRADRFIGDILSERKRIGGFFFLLLGILLIPISLLDLFCGRFFLAKLFFANNKCDGCEICAKNCPVGAIRMWGNEKRPFWTISCESCMRCMAYCPKSAVEASQSMGIGLWYVSGIAISLYISNLLGSHIPGADLIQNLCRFIIAGALYYGFSLLARVPFFRVIFTYTTLTHIYRRYHEPETSLKDFSGKS